MLTDKRGVTGKLMMFDTALPQPGCRISKRDCRTRSIVGDFYLCQNNRAECEYVFPFGISYLCRSPHRCDYAKPPS